MWGFPGGAVSRQCRRHRFNPGWGRSPEDPLEWQPTPGFLPGKPHGQRSLAGHSSWGHRESDTTERLNTHTYTKQVTKDSTGNPTQCSVVAETGRKPRKEGIRVYIEPIHFAVCRN